MGGFEEGRALWSGEEGISRWTDWKVVEHWYQVIGSPEHCHAGIKRRQARLVALAVLFGANRSWEGASSVVGQPGKEHPSSR